MENEDLFNTNNSDENIREYVWQKITRMNKALLAKRAGIEEGIIRNPSKKKIDEWKNYFFNLPLDSFLDQTFPFIVAGKFTTYLFIYPEALRKFLLEQKKKKKLVAMFEEAFSQWFPNVFTFEDSVYIRLFYPEGINYEWVRPRMPVTNGKEEKTRPQLTEVWRYSEGWIVIHLDLGVIEIRFNKTLTSRKIKSTLERIFQIKLTQLTFEPEEINRLIEFAKVTNSSIRYETGPISSQRLAAKKHGRKTIDLSDTKEFQEAVKRGEIVSAYLYIPYQFLSPERLQLSNESEDNTNEEEILEDEEDPFILHDLREHIGINVSFYLGKLTFGTSVEEYEVKEFLENFFNKIIDLEKKRAHVKGIQTPITPSIYTEEKLEESAES